MEKVCGGGGQIKFIQKIEKKLMMIFDGLKKWRL